MYGQAILTEPLTRLSGSRFKPIEYLNFARRDILEEDDRAATNSLTNLKRAIDSQLDIILEIYGLLKLSEQKNCSFPKKIETIRKLGAVAPGILKEINRKRVQLEHYHKKPDKKEVTEFIDITEMFLELFKHRTHRIALLIDYDADIALRMDVEKDEIRIYGETKLLLEAGGIHSFEETVIEKRIEPIKTIPMSDIDSWTDYCGKYLRWYWC